MLLNFSVENALSFRQSQQFSMQRTVHAKNGSWPHPDVSTLAAIYGGNASGKTNLLKCITFLKNFVEGSFKAGNSNSKINALPFLLNKESENEPSTFFIEFIAKDNNRYKYWFTFNNDYIIEEALWLFRSTTNRKTVLFEREHGKPMRFGSNLKTIGKTVEKITRDNALFLSAAAASGVQALQAAYEEITSTQQCRTVDFDKYSNNLITVLQENPDFASNISKLLKYADLGLKGVTVQSEQLDAKQSEKLARLANLLNELDGDNNKLTDNTSENTEKLQKFSVSRLMFTHSGQKDCQLPEDFESLGTKTALLLFAFVIDALSKHSILLIDEIDTSLSMQFVSEILKLYSNPETNPNQSQLIFTTHDLSLISNSGTDKTILDRDQIWFIEKNTLGESSLHPLTEWENRNVNFGKNYQHNIYASAPQPSLYDVFAEILTNTNRS